MHNRSFTKFEIIILLILGIFRRPIFRAQEICRSSGGSEQEQDQKIAVSTKERGFNSITGNRFPKCTMN